MARARNSGSPVPRVGTEPSDTIPWHLRGKPKPVHIEAFRRAPGKEAFAFFLEQGLGKTSLWLNEGLHSVEISDADRIAVVCPNHNKVDVWVDQIDTWTGIHPKHVTVWPAMWTKDTLIFIMNYEATITVGGEKALRGYLNSSKVYFVLDEAHYIKNHASLRTKTLLKLRELAAIRRPGTGTPMTQSVMDLYPQLRFAGELSGVNPYQFRNYYAKMGGYLGKKVIGINEDRKAELQEIRDRCSFRALKKDWTTLPEKLYGKRGFEMAGRQLKIYREMKQDFVAMLGDEDSVSAQMVITQMMKLQQISRGFVMDEQGKTHDLVEPKDNPAMKSLVATLEEGDKKAIVFTNFRYSAKAIYFRLSELGLEPALIMGGAEGAMDATNRFNKDSKCRVMVAQEAMATGYTWLGAPGRDRCSLTVFYENSYSLVQRLQAEDRNHREGQDEDVLYLDLVGSKQDRDITKALTIKRDNADEVVDNISRTIVDSIRSGVV